MAIDTINFVSWEECSAAVNALRPYQQYDTDYRPQSLYYTKNGLVYYFKQPWEDCNHNGGTLTVESASEFFQKVNEYKTATLEKETHIKNRLSKYGL